MKGFSLIELLIAVAVTAILATIAYPSYTQYVQQSRRSQVIANLSGMAQWLERQYSNSNQYPPASDTDLVALISAAETNWYTVAYTVTTTNSRRVGYSLTATAQGQQAQDVEKGTACSSLTFTSIGNQTPAACWNG